MPGLKNKKIGLMTIAIALFILMQIALADTTWTAYTMINSPLPTDYVSDIDFDNSGNQYVGTTGGGLVHIADSVWTIWNESNTGVPIDAVRFAVGDTADNLWLGAASGNLDSSPYGFGVARLDGLDSTWSMKNHGLEVNQIVTGIIFEDGLRYVSTYGGGITVYSDSGWVRYRFDTRTEFSYIDSTQQVFDVAPGTYIPSDYLRAMDLDIASGSIWIATADGGAVKKAGDQWDTFNTSNSGLPSNQLRAVNVNQTNGDICFGTAGFGAALLSGSGWTLYNSANSPLTDNFIASIEFNPTGSELWLGTGYGVWVLENDGDWRSYIPGVNNFIWGEFYSDISFDSSGYAWVSAYGGGMASLYLDSLPPLPPPDSLDVDINKLFIFFFNNRPVERLLARMQVNNAPDLSDPDTISFRLDTDFGELYEFELTFDDFSRGWFHYGGRTTYRYIHDWLIIFLRIKNSDHSDIKVTILDLNAEMNRDNYKNTITATLRLGDRYGVDIVNLGNADQNDVAELNVEGESNTAAAYGVGIGSELTGIDEYKGIKEMNLNLSNYPNPFNGRTMINLSLPDGGAVEINVYDVLGRLVSSVYSGYLSAGDHQYAWPTAGERLAPKSGVYYYRVIIDGYSRTGKMMYLR